jgi:DNA-binding NtrC family response regulator
VHAAEAASPSAAVPGAAPRHAHAETGGRERTRVLVVDDDPAIVDLVGRALPRFGLEVRGFTAPDAALAAVRADPNAFDAVITDQTMPGTSGVQLTEELLNLRPDLPIILATGYAAETDAASARAAGVRAFVQKPVNITQLARLVGECTGRTGPQGEEHV